jgi:hypothetical protein
MYISINISNDELNVKFNGDEFSIKINNDETPTPTITAAEPTITAAEESFTDYGYPAPYARYRQWATKPVTRAMVDFSKWIEREFPELGKVTDERNQRLIMIASKAYGAFQASDLNTKD